MSRSPDPHDGPPASESATLPPPDDRSPSASDALTATGRVFRDLPGAVFPAYLLALGTASVARVPVLLAVALALGLLDRAGRIDPILREVKASAEEIQARESVPPEVAGALRDLVTPEVIALVAGGVIAGFVVFALARAVSTAVTQTTVWAALSVGSEVGPVGDDGDPTRTPAERALTAGVRGAGHWRAFLGLFLLKLLLVGLFVGVPAVLTAGLASVSRVAAVAGGLLLAVGGLVTALALLLLSFAGPAIVVDRAGTLGAAKRSVGFVRRHVGTTLAFVLVAGGLYVGAGVLAGAFSLVGAGRVGGFLVPLVVSPLIDLLATGLYAGVETTDEVASDETTADDGGFQWVGSTDHSVAGSSERGRQSATPGVTVPIRERGSIRTRLRELFGGGLRTSLGILRRHPLAVGVALLAFVLGGVGGWTLTASAGVAVDPPDDVAGVFGPLPVNDFLNIAANNWLVAASGTYSGLAFALPALSAATFNGALIGALAGVFDRVALIALVAPHGVIEVPALLLAWGLGVHLGVVGWRAVRGRTDAVT
ncbi:MAG: stage II sporulation protein M, partial [Halobaculum sp.]